MPTSSPPAVVPAGPEDRDRCTAALVAAFVGDPLTRWMFPDAGHYLDVYPRLLRHFGGGAHDLGTARRTDDFAAAALWLPPGETVEEEALGALVQQEVAPERLDEVFSFLIRIGQAHPPGEHWYLAVIGVDPFHQGAGRGSLLLAHTVAEIDRRGEAAYLESSAAANVPLYERFGFEVVAEVQEGASPTVWPMLRPARTRA